MAKRGLLIPLPLFEVTTDPDPSGDFITIGEDGRPVLHCHVKQRRALETHCRILLVLAGWQSGKSSVGPAWLVNEMRRQGPGDYLTAAPSFPLLDRYPVPNIDRLLGRLLGLGEVVGGAKGQFTVSAAGHDKLWPDRSKWPEYDERMPSRIIFGHADNPDSLAAFTGKGAWLDEPGQKRFKQESFEEVRGRLSTTAGRMLLTSRPYVHHWLKTDVYERADRNRRTRAENVKREANGEPPFPLNPADDGYEVVHFESIDNPKFKKAEWDSAKLTMPTWRFDMKYRGLFTKPAGAIYDCFLDEPDATGFCHIVPKGFIPDPSWRLLCGIDFGAPNFRATFLAEEPGTKKRIAFAEYAPEESKKNADHIAAMYSLLRKLWMTEARRWAAENERAVGEWQRLPDLCVGGAKSEGQWRTEFGSLGWPIRHPDPADRPSAQNTRVKVGIGRVYATIAEDRLFVSEDCPKLIADLKNYSYVVDDDGNSSEEIEDKEMFHSADSIRYILSFLEAKGIGFRVITSD